MPDDGRFVPSPAAPPHDAHAERAVLGAVLLDPSCFPDAAAIVTAEDFYQPAHGVIFTAIGAVLGRGAPLDIVTLKSELESRNRLNAIGGMQYLGDLTDYIPTIAHLETHARIVHGWSRVRAAMDVSRTFLAAVQAGGAPADLLSDFARNAGAAAELREDAKPLPIRSFLAEVFENLERGSAARGVTGVPSGFPALDALTTGFHGGELIILAARPGVGKSALAGAIQRNAAAHTNDPALLFSLEMPGRENASRLLAAEAGVPAALLRAVQVSRDQMGALMRAADVLSALPIVTDQSAKVTPAQIAARARRLQRTQGLSLVVVDYLQLVTAEHQSDSREREVSEMSRAFKLMAKELNVPVVLLSQLNRKCEERADKRPMLSDLRESGAIEQDADTVLFVYRDEMYRKDSPDKGIAEVIVAKQRNGPCDTARLAWRAPTVQFATLATGAPGDARGAGDAYDDFPRGADDGY